MLSAVNLLWLLVISRLQLTLADIPVHCIPEDVFGVWSFISDGAPSKELTDCGHGAPNTVLKSVNMVGREAHEKVLGPTIREDFQVTLTNLIEKKVDGDTPHLTALGHNGEKGTWTLIADEGFEVRFGNRTYAAKFEFEILSEKKAKNGDFLDKIGKFYGRAKGHTWTDLKHPLYGCHCDRTSVGWHSRSAHDGSLQFGCFYAERPKPAGTVLSQRKPVKASQAGLLAADAKKNSPLQEYTALVQMDGKRKNAMRLSAEVSAKPGGPFKNSLTSLLKVSKAALPDRFDWRDQPYLEQVGDDLDSEIDQGPCGSCYAFAATKSLSMRFRIQLAKKLGRPTSLSLSWRSTARCSPFSEGCNGGWPLFIGRLATEVGLYQKTDTVLKPKCKADSQGDEIVDQQCSKECGITPDRHAQPVWFAKDYGYVGGFAQGATEELIKEEIYRNGPVAMELTVTALPAFIYGNSGDPIVTFDEDAVLRDSVSFGSPTNKGVPQPHGINASVLASGRSMSEVAKFNGWQWMDHVIIGVGWGVEPPARWGTSALSLDARPHVQIPRIFVNTSANSSSTVKRRYAHTPTPYWHIRNSWGEYWGKKGYAKLLRGKNTAGVEISATWIEPDLDRMPSEIPEPKLSR